MKQEILFKKFRLLGAAVELLGGIVQNQSHEVSDEDLAQWLDVADLCLDKLSDTIMEVNAFYSDTNPIKLELPQVDDFDVWADRVQSLLDRWSNPTIKQQLSPSQRVKACFSEINDGSTQLLIQQSDCKELNNDGSTEE